MRLFVCLPFAVIGLDSRLKLFFKLFVVMGVTWIFEFAVWLLNVEGFAWHWVILDMFNLMQSIGIFFIFVCKRKILNQLEQKYPRMKGYPLD
jgi:bacteriorhodopsin